MPLTRRTITTLNIGSIDCIMGTPSPPLVLLVYSLPHTTAAKRRASLAQPPPYRESLNVFGCCRETSSVAQLEIPLTRRAIRGRPLGGLLGHVGCAWNKAGAASTTWREDLWSQASATAPHLQPRRKLAPLRKAERRGQPHRHTIEIARVRTLSEFLQHRDQESCMECE